MSASRMSSAEYLLQKTYQILCFVFFCILLKCCKSRKGAVGKVENKPNNKTDLIREQVNITMFTKLILQLKSDRISFTVLMIEFSSDCPWK